MKSTAIESIATRTAGGFVRQIRLSGEDSATRRHTRWGTLYAILLMGVGLCVLGSRIVSFVGHPAVLQYGVVLAILGLLAAWVRSNRASLSTDKPGTLSPSEQPFSVIHVAFLPETIGSGHRVLTAQPQPVHRAAAVQPAANASQR
jgi:hypothetical protein